ncbi:MAG: hypothetical protein HGGPFJEG_02343 [Ignavibacteria bacterium]|nr:hypothetical protein [Ignavibacteria bacterium]
MRTAGEKILKDYKNFISINGSAEISGLNKNSIDFIICSQSFHWFDRILCKKEFCRILKKNGYLVLIWNSRISKHGFMDEYENLLLKFGIDYVNVNHDNIDESEIRDFFSPSSYVLKKFGNHQDLNFDSLLGRLLSSSYVPLKGSPDFDGMIIELKKIFNKNNYNGKVRMKYETIVYCGKLFIGNLKSEFFGMSIHLNIEFSFLIP